MVLIKEAHMEGKGILTRKRVAKGWSMKHFAELLGVSVSAVEGWEKGKHRMRQSLVPQVAKFLGLTPQEAARLPVGGRGPAKASDARKLLESHAVVTAEDLKFLVELEPGMRPMQAHLVAQILVHRLRKRGGVA